MSDADQLKLQFGIEVDSSNVAPHIAQVKTQFDQLGESAKNAGDKGAEGLKKFGEEADKQTEKTKRQANSIVRAMERAMSDLAAVNGRASEKFAFMSKLRGVDDDPQVKKTIASLVEMERQRELATQGMNKMGMSAKQLQASMRGLPAQFTDIFTSLASGQSPMMVMIQQGGQIKDMFGGMVPALKAVGTGLMAMINPWTVAAAAIGTISLAMYQASKEAHALNRALIDTGNASGVSLSKLQETSAAISDRSGSRLTQGASAEAIEALVRAGVRGEEAIRRFGAAMAEFERAGGDAVKKVAENFRDLGEDPYKATMKLNQGMNFLSVEAWKTIDALERQGNVIDAARIAQEEYAKALEKRAPQMLQNLGYVEQAWLGIKDAVKGAWDAVLNIGREGDEVAKLTKDIATLRATLASPGASANWGMQEGSQGRKDAEAKLRALEQQLSVARMINGVDDAAAKLQAQQAEQVAALDRLRERQLQYRKEDTKLEADIVKMKWDGVRAGWTQLEIEAEEARMRKEKAKEKKGRIPTGAEDMAGLAKEWERIYLDAAKSATHLTAEQDKLSKSQEKILAFLTHPAFQKMPVPWQQAVLQILYSADAMERANDSLEEFEKIWKSVSKSIDSDSARYDRETKGILDKAKALELEAKQLGVSREAQRQLSIENRNVEIQRLEALATSMDIHQQGEQAIKDIYDRIAALKKLNDAEKTMGRAESADDARKEWLKTAESIENALTDALMRGFEKGKGFAESLVDSIKNGLKSLVAKIIIKPVMQNATNAIGSLFSIPGAPGAGAGGSGVAGGGLDLSTITSLFGAGGMSGAFMAGTGWLTGATTLGGAFGAAGSLIGTGTAGGVASGAMMGLGAAAPFLAAAYIGYSILSNNRRNHQPAQQNYSVVGPGGNPYAGVLPNLQSATAYLGTLDPLQLGVSAAARGLGGNVSSFQYGMYSSASPNGRGATIDTGVWDSKGRRVYGGWSNDTNESMDARLQAEIPRMFFAALAASEVPVMFKDFFDKFDASKMTQEHLNTILEATNSAKQMADAFAQLGGPFEQLTKLSVEARVGILDMVGGLDQFMQKVNGYYNDFYSEEEKQALSLANVDKTLTNVGLNPDKLKTKEDFRALLEGIDTTTEEGKRQYAALINSAGAFSFGVGLLDKTGKSLGDITTGAPEMAGVDLMVTAQQTTNSLLDKIEKAIRDVGRLTVEAIEGSGGGTVYVGSGGGGEGGEVTYYGGTTGGGN